MQRRSKVAIGVAGLVALGVVLLCGLLGPDADGPDARQVEAMVERDYKRPERHTLMAAVKNFDEEPHFVEWARRYDGVDMSTRVMSKRGPNGWEMRWHRELSEPEPLRSSQILPMTTVLGTAEQAAAFLAGDIRVRLLYRAQYAQPSDPKSADLVVERYQLVYELATSRLITFVDAYTGRVLDAVSKAVR